LPKSCKSEDFPYDVYSVTGIPAKTHQLQPIQEIESKNLPEMLHFSGCWKTPVFCEGVEMVHFPHPNFGS